MIMLNRFSNRVSSILNRKYSILTGLHYMLLLQVFDGTDIYIHIYIYIYI